MFDLETYLQDFYDEHGLRETRRRLAIFYGSFLELYEDFLPDAGKEAIRVTEKYRKGEATVDELNSARRAAEVWDENDDRGWKTKTSAHFAVRGAILLTYFENLGDDDEAHYDLGMFLYYVERAEDHTADVEQYLRAAFESP